MKKSKKEKIKVYFKPRTKFTRWLNNFVYAGVRFPLRLLLMLLLGCRLHGYNRLLRNQGYILLANHQSYIDPVSFPAMCLNTFSFAARHTLFRNPLFGGLISFLGAFPIRRGTRDNAAFQQMQEELKFGSSLIIFPEGTRSLDGKIKKFKGGINLILSRTKAPVQIGIVSGNHKILPKYRPLDRLYAYPMNTIFAKPVMPEEYINLPFRDVALFMEQKIRELDAELRRKPYMKMRGITAISQPIVQIINFYNGCIFNTIKIIVKISKRSNKQK